MNEKSIYLDYNATTPIHPEVVEAMMPYLKEHFGNGSSVHAYGRDARYAMEVAREKIANFIGAEPEEILFTSGGTESNNLAIKGFLETVTDDKPHIITTTIEHSSVLRVFQYLEKQGYPVTYLPVDDKALISIKQLEKAIKPETAFISIMHANNEVGTILSVAEAGKLARDQGILFHSDAVQSIGKIPVNVNDLNVDFLAVSGHKIAGPKGIGFLYKRKGSPLAPQILGGSHERNLRAGTENVPYIVGMGKAIEVLANEMETKVVQIQKLRDQFEKGLKQNIAESTILGCTKNRLPNTSAVCFPNCDGSSIMRNLDLAGIAVSTGSACMSGTVQTSHVLEAMGIAKNIAMGGIRFSFGEKNTKDEVDRTLQELIKIISQLHSI